MAQNPMRKSGRDLFPSRIDRARQLFLQLAHQKIQQAPFLCRAFLALEQCLSQAFSLEFERLPSFLQLAKEELIMADVFFKQPPGNEVEGKQREELLGAITLCLHNAFRSMTRFTDSHDRTFLFDARQQLQNALHELQSIHKKAA